MVNYGGVLATPGFSRRFYLMELDSLLQPIKQHIEIPAHFPKIHFSQSQITNGEWFTGETTFNYFFFDSLVVYSYDVISQQTSRLVLQDPYQNRLTNSMNHDFIALKYGGIPSHLPSNRKDDLGDNYELIQASKMSQDQNRIAVNLLYYGGEYSILILYDLMSGEKKFIKAPPDFNMSYLWNNTITGVVVVPNKPNQVVVLEIEE